MFWLRWVFVAGHRLSLVGGEWGLLLLEVPGLLMAFSSPLVERGFQSTQAPVVKCMGSVVVTCGLSSFSTQA